MSNIQSANQEFALQPSTEGANPMIARATLTREILENPTRNRVSACRKRLRGNRSVHRLGRREPAPPDEQTSPMAQFPADSVQVRQLVTLESSRPFDDKLEESVVQEVGIT
jgi:hypothetical protein